MTRRLNHMPASFLVLNNDKRKIYWLYQGSCPSLLIFYMKLTPIYLRCKMFVSIKQTIFYHLMNFNRWKLHWCNYKSPVAFEYYRYTHPIWNYIPLQIFCIIMLCLSSLLLFIWGCTCFQAIMFVLSDQSFWKFNNMIPSAE